MTSHIRDIVSGDTAVIEQLMTESFEATYGEAWSSRDLASTLSLPGVCGRLYSLQNNPAGFCLSYHLPDAAEILMVAVSPVLRRKGIAKCLIDDAVTLANAAGKKFLFLEVREGNAAARALYDAHGFTTIGRRNQYYKGRDGILRDAVTLRLPLG